MKQFKGNVLFLDRSDINTDEIIPAKYLTEITKEALKPYLLEDLTLDTFSPTKDCGNKGVVISRGNFGCGSSREHAPWAFEVNGINVVIAESYARIFRQNMFNCGMMAIELPSETIDELFKEFGGIDTLIEVNLDEKTILIEGGDKQQTVSFSISEYDEALVNAGGWLEYADKNY
ncbi:MAG: hypothetical protein OCC49_18730 [Fibrobacterales bacterium]